MNPRRATATGVGSGGGSKDHQAVEAKASVALDSTVVVLPRDPHAAAHELAAQLGGVVFAWRWAKALIEALS